MKFEKTERGFGLLTHPAYCPKPGEEPEPRLAQHSSVVGFYKDSFARPGTSALWVGRDHHLCREDVQQLVAHLQSWLDTGSLEIKGSDK